MLEMDNATRRVLREATDSSSPSWIFGLPFFTTFHLTTDSMDARSVSLAVADESCNAKSKPVGSSGSHVKELMSTNGGLMSPMAVDPRKLRFPRRGVLDKSTSLQATKLFAGV